MLSESFCALVVTLTISQAMSYDYYSSGDTETRMGYDDYQSSYSNSNASGGREQALSGYIEANNGLRYRVVLRECNRGDETDQGCACYPGWHHTLGDGKIVSYCDRKLSTKAPEAEKTETNAADPKYLVAMGDALFALLSVIFFIITLKRFWNLHSRKRAGERLTEAIELAKEELRKEQGDTVDLKPTPWIPPEDSSYVLLYKSEVSSKVASGDSEVETDGTDIE